MNKFLNKFYKCYDIILNLVFVFIMLYIAFFVCYKTLPEQTTQIIAKALSRCDNPELASRFMTYLNGLTLGGIFPLWFAQKATISRYLNNASNTTGYRNTQEILAENLKLLETQIEFQKAEAIRFANSPTMPAKARLHYQSFLNKLEERETAISVLQSKATEVKKKAKKPKSAKVKARVQEDDKLNGLI